MFRGRSLTILIGAAILTCALTTSSRAQHVARGMLFTPGEDLVTELSPSGDVDSYVFYGVEGARISLTLKARSGGLSPTMALYSADMTPLDTSAYTKLGSSKVKLRKYPLPSTGAFFVRIADPLGRTGEYTLKTKGKLRKVPGYPRVTLNPGETYDIMFGAGPGREVSVRLKTDSRKKSVSVLSVFDPDGEEMPHGIGRFIHLNRGGMKASFRITSSARSSWRDDTDGRRLGQYGIRIGGTTSTTTVKIKVKVRHARGRGTREIASTLPAITHLEPDFGGPSTTVTIHGSNFLPGDVQVLFGDSYGHDPVYLSPTEIRARAPFGEGAVDITVINPDGQEGVLEEGFIFIPNPPAVETMTPTIGPDSGGTVVDIYGARLGYIETVSFGDVDLLAKPEAVETWNLRFTTEAIPAGTYDITLTDRFDRTLVIEDAFTFFAAPVIQSISPAQGGGERPVVCFGQNFRPDTVVLVNGAPWPTTYMSSTQLRFMTPPGEPGDKITVGVQDIWDRSSTLPDPYLYAYQEGMFDVTFSNNTLEDTDFTPGAGGIADWNPSTDPGKLVATYGSDTVNTPFTPSQQNSANSFPMGSGAKRVQNWMKASEVGNAGTITGLYWCPSSNTSGGATHTNFTTIIGHNSSTTGLTSTTFSSNMNVGSPVTVISNVTYTTPSMTQGKACAFPTFTKTFSFDGKNAVVIDNQKTNRSGSTSSWWNRSDTKGRRAYQNNGVGNTATNIDAYAYIYWIDFRSDTSMARSIFYRTESDLPEFLDPIVLPTISSQPQGTDVLVEFQGAAEHPISHDPDPTTYTAWTEDPTEILIGRYIRFRVTFKANLDTEQGPVLDRITVPYRYFD